MWPESAGWPQRPRARRRVPRRRRGAGGAGLLHPAQLAALRRRSGATTPRSWSGAAAAPPTTTSGTWCRSASTCPLQQVLPFVGALARNAGSFAASDRISLLRFGPVTLGLAICFEVIFPVEVAALVREGATALGDPHQRRLVRRHGGALAAPARRAIPRRREPSHRAARGAHRRQRLDRARRQHRRRSLGVGEQGILRGDLRRDAGSRRTRARRGRCRSPAWS